MIQIDELRRYSLFGGASEDTLDYFRQCMRRRPMTKDEVLFRAGDHGDELYFIAAGSVDMFLDQVHLVRFEEGEQFGAMHLIDIMPRSCDAIVRSDGLLFEMNNKDFLQLKRHNPEAYIVIMMNCSRDISRHLRVMNQRVADLVNGRALPAN